MKKVGAKMENVFFAKKNILHPGMNLTFNTKELQLYAWIRSRLDWERRPSVSFVVELQCIATLNYNIFYTTKRRTL